MKNNENKLNRRSKNKQRNTELTTQENKSHVTLRAQKWIYNGSISNGVANSM